MAIVWGRRDCATAAAAHIEALSGVDVLAPWRGLYGSARSAARLQAQSGGLVAMTDAALAVLGDLWTRDPATPEIAVLGLPGGQVLAVRQGDWWRVPGPEGATHLRRDAVAPLATWGPADG